MTRQKIALDVFHEVFKSMQLITYYVLYYDQDFSIQQVKNFNKFLAQHNEELRFHTNSVNKLEQIIKQNTGIDCEKMAKNFPYRVKMKLYGKKTKHPDVVYYNATDCIEDFLIICIHTLRKNYRFSVTRINQWWEQVIEFSRLYVDGLTDEHVLKYFLQECGLEITE